MAVRPPLILTLKLDAFSFRGFDDLRRAHFPPERNVLPAHVTLFHALPGEQEDQIRHRLRQASQETTRLSLTFPTVRFLGRGVAVVVQGEELVRLRNRLAEVWRESLTSQDRQKYQPHVTVQNKVEPAQARALFEGLSTDWRSLKGSGEGLLLWRYLGGPWELVEEFRFR